MKKVFFILLIICSAGNCFAQYDDYFDDEEYYEDEEYVKYERWRISIAGGPGYIYSSSKDAENELIDRGIDKQKVKDSYNSYRWGWQGNADIHYLFNSHIGVGVKYSLFQTSSKLEQISFGNYNGDRLHIFFGDLEDKLYVNYVGPSFLWQNFTNRWETWKVTSLLSVGYASYRSESYVMEFPSLVTSNTLGVYGEFGLEHYLSRNVAIGVKVNYILSSFKKFKIKNSQGTSSYELPDKEEEDISRFDLSLGFSFYF